MLNLIESIAEKGVHCMVGSEILLEDKQFIHIVEDPMEEWTQKVRTAVHFFHFSVSNLIDLLFLLLAYRWDWSVQLLLFGLFLEKLFHFLNLKH